LQDETVLADTCPLHYRIPTHHHGKRNDKRLFP
jgi:hypothetical protein